MEARSRIRLTSTYKEFQKERNNRGEDIVWKYKNKISQDWTLLSLPSHPYKSAYWKCWTSCVDISLRNFRIPRIKKIIITFAEKKSYLSHKTDCPHSFYQSNGMQINGTYSLNIWREIILNLVFCPYSSF